MPTRSFPGPGACKPAFVGLAAALIVLAGCGSAGDKGESPSLRTVTGPGFRFSAFPDWRVRRSEREVAVASGPVDLVSVTTLRLARRYEPRLWRTAVPALDRLAAQLTTQLQGRLDAGSTVVVGGRRARRYDISFRRSGRSLVERIGFVLVGRSEHQLLCRFEAGADDAACRTLFSSFRLG